MRNKSLLKVKLQFLLTNHLKIISVNKILKKESEIS